eukprot:3653405-Rhodomonas_salina.4
MARMHRCSALTPAAMFFTRLRVAACLLQGVDQSLSFHGPPVLTRSASACARQAQAQAETWASSSRV